ncbi:anthranilate synthase family protein [Agromyces bauzanensis]|uniref:anthranilate synthase n=1 Tax=Agromyces bauzanensis TaxID=1308924 RepID=A0A917P936_9MICO|nr:anthranilate synthase family protein [Agromyces bauzanensis]GGJ67053.1 hypothetical protein GCM10011372_01060 [Agromyces bauzanensis]
MTRLLTSLDAASQTPPFVVIHREHESKLDVLVGDVVDVDLLAGIPLDGAEVLALVPFRQVRERGFAAHDDGAPIRCLVVRERESVPLAEAIGLLPRHPVIVDDLDVDVSDADYAATVRRVIAEEIGRGEGASFVIRREFTGTTDAAPATAVLGWMRALLEHESGAYWTFALHTPGLAAVGATPERHVSSIDGTVSMNPISGTFRHGDEASDDDRFLSFLHDVKEREELVMVVDEELKMMSAVCPDGGRIRGPFLKRMSRLTHTEYLLEGRSELDPREVLRRTMFAPTVTGSPLGNACAVIARHEATPRGYYAGVLARFTPRGGGYDLDAPILIRTAYLGAGGRVRVPVGATLVRHSDPAGEVAEALVVDANDDFTTMLAHQLRHLGVAARVVPWHEAALVASEGLVVFGPGPGDPRNRADPRVARLRELIMARLASGRPMLAVCLSHQVLADLAGLPLSPLPVPRQGLQLEVEVFGRAAAIAFYNTFSAVAPNGSTTPARDLEVASDATTGVVHALRGAGVASVQGHLESVTSPDGLATLERLLDGLLPDEEVIPRHVTLASARR